MNYILKYTHNTNSFINHVIDEKKLLIGCNKIMKFVIIFSLKYKVEFCDKAFYQFKYQLYILFIYKVPYWLQEI